MRKTLKVVAFGGGPVVPSYDTDAQAFITAANITNSTQQTAINTLVTDLKTYSIWNKMKAIYPMVGGTATSHSYNLKNTSQYQITWNGGLTHSSNGVLPNGTNGYGNTNLNPSSFTSLHYSYYSRTTNTSGREIGIETSGGAWDIIISLGGTIYGRFGSSSSISSSNSDSKGFYLNTEASTLSHKLFKNNTQLGNISFSGAGYPNYNVFICAINILGGAGNFGSRQCAFSSIGDGLTDTEAANLYTSIQKFQTTLNRFVGTPIYPSFDSDAQSFMTSASITDSTQQAAVNYLVTDLKSNNLWTKMKAIYPMVGGTATSHSYNLKNPSQFQITWSGGITHSSNGVLPNGTNGYGNTNFNPSLNLTTSSAHQSFYFRTNRTINKSSEYGCYDSNPSKFSLGPYSWSAGWISDIFDNTTSRIISNAGNSTGYVIATRSSSSSHKLFRNNTQIASTSNSTTGNIPNANYALFSLLGPSNVTNGYYDDNQIAFGSLGDGLTDAESSTLYTIIQNYQTILSRNI